MNSTKPLVMALAMTCFPLHAANALDCGTDRPVSVAGRVSTINVSDTKQVGQICLTLTDGGGREVFDDCGALVGKVVGADTSGNTYLDHTALFSILNAFQTSHDVGQFTAVVGVDDTGTPCAFSAVERITNVSKGTGIFRDATFDVTAQGTVSYCPSKNLNTFQLSGHGCLKKRR